MSILLTNPHITVENFNFKEGKLQFRYSLAVQGFANGTTDTIIDILQNKETELNKRQLEHELTVKTPPIDEVIGNQPTIDTPATHVSITSSPGEEWSSFFDYYGSHEDVAEVTFDPQQVPDTWELGNFMQTIVKTLIIQNTLEALTGKIRKWEYTDTSNEVRGNKMLE